MVEKRASKELSRYGLRRYATRRTLPRSTERGAVSAFPEESLPWTCSELAAQGSKVRPLAYDDAGPRVGDSLRPCARQHNRAAKGTGRVQNAAQIGWKSIHVGRAIAGLERLLDPAGMAGVGPS